MSIAGKDIVKENYEWFKDHLEELRKKYDNRYVVIKDKVVIGDYEDFSSAYDAMITKGEKLGTFIIQQCIDASKNMMIVHNHVILDAAEATA